MKTILSLAALVLLIAANAPPSQTPSPRATVSVAKDRFDDLVWENDLTAHRIYGRPLEAQEPPSSSGIDAWAKRVPYPVMRGMIARGRYHDEGGEGVDFYSVHGTRGAGGLGIWFDNKLWTSRNYRRVRILEDGPNVARFAVDYAPWPVDVGRTVRETRSFELPMGSHFTRMTSQIDSNVAGPFIVGIGIAKFPTAREPGTLTVDRAKGVISWWSPPDPQHGSMGVALRVDPRSIVDIREDAENHLVLLRQTAGKPFVYYMGAVWDRGGNVRSGADWAALAEHEPVDFRAGRATPAKR